MRNPFGNPKELQRMMDQAMKGMEEAKERVKQIQVEASSGGGVVKATVNGEGEVLALHIDPMVVDPTDTEMLEDLVLSAIREARTQAMRQASALMNSIPGLPNIGGLLG